MNLIASAAGGAMSTTELWLIISTLALTVVTALTAILMVREQNRHSETTAKSVREDKAELAEIIHEVIAAEHEEEMARLANTENKEPTE